mgnify:CR=1 FL=1
MKPSSFYLSTTKKVLEDCRSFIDINNQDNDIYIWINVWSYL